MGGLSPLGSHSEKEGIGCALTDTNDAARGAGIQPPPLGAKLQCASTGVPVLHNINSSGRLGWVGGSLSQRLWQVLMMQEAAASHWTRECSAWKSLKCNNYKWIYMWVPKIFSPASDNTHRKCFFSAAYDLENTWSARVNPKGALGPDKCLCLPTMGV